MSIVQNLKLDKLDFLPGNAKTLGTQIQEDGTNFCVYSPTIDHLELHIFQKEEDTTPYVSYILDPSCNKTGNFWHVFVKGLKVGGLYLFSVFNDRENEDVYAKYILDPYFKQLTHHSIFLSAQLQGVRDDSEKNDASLLRDGEIQNSINSKKLNTEGFPKCVVIDDASFDWEDDKSPHIPLSECVIYEAHLKGLSINAPMETFPNSFTKTHEVPPTDALVNTAHTYLDNPTKAHKKYCEKGTYKGLIELIPYFKKLNITTIELMPIFEFDPNEINYLSKTEGIKRTNYWGYSPLSFFAPKASYATEPKNAVNEFKEMVKALHKANIELVLDVVFNHTAEGGETGGTFCFKALAEKEYYFLNKAGQHLNYSGCGNTFNSFSDIGRKIIIDALCYWVQQMHVDGFRFDLASMLMREGEDGDLINTTSSIIQEIEKCPVLQKVKMIAEPWDACDNYQLGNFPKRWLEWNDKYRDTLRRFWLLENNKPKYENIIDALKGSPHIFTSYEMDDTGSNCLINNEPYNIEERYIEDINALENPYPSVNFITCHDGFTLQDLVSYNQKHNEQNGEENRDGSNNNLSYNHGHEGSTQNDKINSLRVRQIKNMLFSLFVSNGVPMLLMGDECMRTQKGNNNPYCQDNSISYFDWSLLEKKRNLFEYVSFLCHFKRVMGNFSIFSRKRAGKVEFFDEIGNKIDSKTNKTCKFISCFLKSDRNAEKDFFVILNASSHDVTVRLPAPSSGKWCIVLDTALDILDESFALNHDRLNVQDFSESKMISCNTIGTNVKGRNSLNVNELIISKTPSVHISVAHSATLLSTTMIQNYL